MNSCIEQDSLAIRRSIYNLGNSLSTHASCLTDTIEDCVKNCPTPFNAQSARVVVLQGDKHQKFWDLVWKNLQKSAPSYKLKSAKEKLDLFARANGTILYYEDNDELEKLKEQFPLYQNNMRDWVMQANGILEYMIWQALAENGIGASLQHYTELVEEDVAKMLDIPTNWKLVAQMPFGSIEKEPAEKTFLPLEERIRLYN